MSDNPFSEPDDSERTVVRLKGSAMAPPAPAPSARPPERGFGPAYAAPQRLAGESDSMPKVGKSPMTAAAAPLLDLLARIGAGAQGTQVGNAEDVRQGAVRALQTFEAECRASRVPDEQLRAAHYALCAALDDAALATPWGQSSEWASRSLSSTFHQDVRSGERFFDLLSGMQKEPGRYLPALEICYYCLALGFRGRYRLDSRGGVELDRIREGLYVILSRLNGAFERELSPHWRGVDAPHRGPGRDVPPWVVVTVAVSLLAFGYLFVSWSTNKSGDALQQRMAQLPPLMPPTIQRAAVPTQPAAAPSIAPDLVDKFRKFLEPEIKQGLVVVEGDAQRVLIRVLARGMFSSGSADIQPPFDALLRHIGEPLRMEPGRVSVLGHSDNQAIRTVRFPSNFQLSAARAEAARVVLANATAQPERFTSVGRADTEPLTTNDTAEGRERNRRIDIVLSRGEGR